MLMGDSPVTLWGIGTILCWCQSSERGRCCVQDALLPGQVLHRRLSSVDSSVQAGNDSGLMPHTALRRCLDAWVPLLIDECDFAAAFLLLYKPIDEVPGAGQDPYAAGESRGRLDMGALSMQAWACLGLSSICRQPAAAVECIPWADSQKFVVLPEGEAPLC